MNQTVRKSLYPTSDAERVAEWRRSFVRSATVSVMSRLRKTSAEEIEREIRAPVTPMKASDFPGTSVSRLMLLAPRSTAAKLFELADTVDLAGISSLNFFPTASNFAAASFVGEAAPIPVRQGLFAGQPIGPTRKLALISALSAELENASGGIAQTAIARTLELAIGRGLDAVLLSDSAETDEAPAGLLFGLTPLPGSDNMVTDLAALIGAITASGIDGSSVVFVAATAQALAISLTAGPHFAHKVIEASSLAAGTVIAVASAALVVGGDGTDPQIDISKQALLHVADPASQIAVIGAPNGVSAPVVSTYQADLIALRAIARICWSAAPDSVEVLTGATW